MEPAKDNATDGNRVRISGWYARPPESPHALTPPLACAKSLLSERATAYVCRDTATAQLISSVFLLENESGGEMASPRASAADKAAVGLTPDAQVATVGEEIVQRMAMFGAITTAARVEDTASAGCGRHKYVGMFGTHPTYQQR